MYEQPSTATEYTDKGKFYNHNISKWANTVYIKLQIDIATYHLWNIL